MPICSICGEEVPLEKMVGDMCINCASTIQDDDAMEDFS